MKILTTPSDSDIFTGVIQKTLRFIYWLLLFVTLFFYTLSRASAQDSPAAFTIHSAVVAPNPPRVGFNFSVHAGANITQNSWVKGGGFSTSDLRHDYKAMADGAMDGTTFIATDASYFHSLNSNGAFVGAQARVYRFNSNAWTLVRTGVVQSMTAVGGSTAPADNTITFTTPGAQSKAGDVIWLTKDGYYTNTDDNQWVNNMDPRFGSFYPNWSAEGESQSIRNDPNPCTYTRVTDVPPGQTNGTADAPPVSLKITTTATTGTAGIWQFIAELGTQSTLNDVEQFEPGHTYSVSVWLKQQGIPSNSAIVKVGPQTFTCTNVTGTWQQFTFSFLAPTNLGNGQTIRIDYTTPGTLWVNQVQVWDTAHDPFTMDSRVLTSFQNFKPGTIRFWSMLDSSSKVPTDWSLDENFQNENSSRTTPVIGAQGEQNTTQYKLPAALALCSQVGATPWFICNMSWSEADWSHLIEFLAAPAGVGFASKRPANHPGPYTDDFSKIYLEAGDEQWNTEGGFQVITSSVGYGQFVHYIFSQAIAGKTYFDSSKIRLLLSNFTQAPSFGYIAIANCPEAQGLDYFLYTGGSLTGDAGFQADLLALEPYKNNIAAWTANEKTSAANGRPYEIASYEGGPGTDDPSSTGLGDTSLAAATGALDVYLYAEQNNFSALSFYNYGLGDNLYTSHSVFRNGYIPHPVWEALQMANQHCAGSMVSIDTNAVQLTTDGASFPLTGCYTFKNGNEADIVVISRDLNNTTPVTLHLPGVPNGSTTLYTLTGNPRATNSMALNIPIQTQVLGTISRDYSFTMPAGSVYVFTVPMTWPGVAPQGVTALGGTNKVTVSWSAYAGATSYNVYRSTTPGGEGHTPYVTGVTSAAFYDTSVINGTAYYYQVTAVTASGETDISNESEGTPQLPGVLVVSIDCGDATSGTAPSGWVTDVDGTANFFTVTGGTLSTNPSTINVAAKNAAPQAVYQLLRTNSSTYTFIDLFPNSTYTIRLHNVEKLWTASNKRMFNVSVNGVQMLTNYDVFAAAGGKNIATVEDLPVTSDAFGNIKVQMDNGSADLACVSGIQLITGNVTGTLGSSIDSGLLSGTPPLGWILDTYYTGTWTNSYANAFNVSGPFTAPQAVYQTIRLGAMTYTIPGLTAGKTYTVRLHFSEPFWTSANSRQFNVAINGTSVLKNFDVFKTSGGKAIALAEDIPAVANTSGQIVVAFSAGAADNAMINGIQVLIDNVPVVSH